jgi:hypothetical protein
VGGIPRSFWNDVDDALARLPEAWWSSTGREPDDVEREVRQVIANHLYHFLQGYNEQEWLVRWRVDDHPIVVNKAGMSELVMRLRRLRDSWSAALSARSSIDAWAKAQRPLLPTGAALSQFGSSHLTALIELKKEIDDALAMCERLAPQPQRRRRGRVRDPRREWLGQSLTVDLAALKIPMSISTTGVLGTLLRLVLTVTDRLLGQPVRRRPSLWKDLKRWVTVARAAQS